MNMFTAFLLSVFLFFGSTVSFAETQTDKPLKPEKQHPDFEEKRAHIHEVVEQYLEAHTEAEKQKIAVEHMEELAARYQKYKQQGQNLQEQRAETIKGQIERLNHLLDKIHSQEAAEKPVKTLPKE